MYVSRIDLTKSYPVVSMLPHNLVWNTALLVFSIMLAHYQTSFLTTWVSLISMVYSELINSKECVMKSAKNSAQVKEKLRFTIGWSQRDGEGSFPELNPSKTIIRNKWKNVEKQNNRFLKPISLFNLESKILSSVIIIKCQNLFSQTNQVKY